MMQVKMQIRNKITVFNWWKGYWAINLWKNTRIVCIQNYEFLAISFHARGHIFSKCAWNHKQSPIHII